MVRRICLVLALAGVALVGMVGPAAAVAAPVNQTPARSWTVNGRVYAVEVVGDIAFVGGQFTAAVSPTGQSVARRNLAAFRVGDGSLVTTWRADAGAVVRAIVSDGSSLWVGGFFRSVGGVARTRLAKLSATTGQVDRTFTATLDDAVRALDLSGGALYAGGHFRTVNGQSRPYLARLDPDSGQSAPDFVGTADGRVFGLRKSPTQDLLWVAGDFTTLGGRTAPGTGAVSSVSGRAAGPVLARTTRPAQTVDVSADGQQVFAGADSNAVTSWRTSSGAVTWRHYGDGNIQAVRYAAGMLYFGFHDGFDGDLTVKLLAADALTGAVDAAFEPTMNQFWGVWAIDVASVGVVVGGDFTSIQGVPAQGWARFLAR